ncbi:hypothetical protein H839_12354 [Parageobacillus genomosp. 1]|uniref:Uncharacterized protein n=1 Tax=Parageobacillus genomosp. 1 TaxID=1295642 RepID=A0ABC9VCM4_9BACL|nr:hypothetical protein [Parageobacillus genomosp. 1]EZP76066.1 hypothetical protein H839_12354 [Parageobacillus genomosp. 1]
MRKQEVVEGLDRPIGRKAGVAYRIAWEDFRCVHRAKEDNLLRRRSFFGRVVRNSHLLTECRWERFIPYGYVLIDEKGNEYKVKKMKVVESKNWVGKFEIRAPGKARVLLTFEVPMRAEKLIMIVRHDWLPGDMAVEVK